MGFKCKNTSGTITYVQYKVFYPRCGKLNQQCNPTGGAYLAASYVCRNRLY